MMEGYCWTKRKIHGELEEGKQATVGSWMERSDTKKERKKERNKEFKG
jgi:hypothetical protein